MSRNRELAIAAVILAAGVALAQAPPAFEVATIKPTAPDWDGGRIMTMQDANRFVVKNYTLRFAVAAAYDLPPSAISGGPEWMDTDGYDILAKTPGERRPSRDDEMAMLRGLLADRFKLSFHREQKELSIYALTIARSGAKLKESAALAGRPEGDQPPALTVRIFPDRVLMPGRNATMAQFAAVLQHGVLDRPVLDRTGLTGRYDFDLEWTPDETQFGGQIRGTPAQPTKPGLFAALQEQLGLKLEAAKGPVEVLVIERVERPSAN